MWQWLQALREGSDHDRDKWGANTAAMSPSVSTVMEKVIAGGTWKELYQVGAKFNQFTFTIYNVELREQTNLTKCWDFDFSSWSSSLRGSSVHKSDHCLSSQRFSCSRFNVRGIKILFAGEKVEIMIDCLWGIISKVVVHIRAHFAFKFHEKPGKHQKLAYFAKLCIVVRIFAYNARKA